MEACSQSSLNEQPFQATLATILRDIKDEFELVQNTSAPCHPPVGKKLTTEALFVISVILFFVILTLIRSSVSVCQSLKAIWIKTFFSICKKKEKTTYENSDSGKEITQTSRYTVFMANLKRFLDCFCVKTNAERLFSTVSNEEHLSSLHGVRAIAVIWVLIGHTAMFYMKAIKTRAEFQSIVDLQATQVFKNTIFIVDVFLVLSGFLNMYLYSQRYGKGKRKISWLSFYAHRFVRIIPMYFLVLGFYSTIFPYLSSGLIWPTYNTNPVCRENWMWHVLFLNNYNSHMKQCLATTWYLPCEMQLYIISPLFLILLMKKPFVGYVFTLLGISVSSIFNFIVTKQHKLVDGITRLGEYYSTDLKGFEIRFWEYFNKIHVKPYSRLGTYLIGMALGNYLSQNKATEIKRNNLLSLGWIMAALFIWISIFALHGREESVLETAVYNGLKHPVFSCSVAWIIFVSVTRKGSFISRFLSNKFFILISRLSYSIYLIHLIILEGYFLSLKELITHSAVPMALLHAQLILSIIAVSFAVSIVFEAPLIRITALLFREAKQETKSFKGE